MATKSVATVEPISSPRTSLVARMADRFGVDPSKMMATLKATAFKTDKGVSDEQMMALLVVAEQYGLNPWTREVYAFPDKGGIVPVVGVDGWSRIINTHPQFDGVEFEQDDESCTCILYRKDRAHATKVTEFFSECRRETGPWKSHPRRMLRHKTLIQCARLAFGFVGIFDEDEAERILERDITPQPDTPKLRDKLRTLPPPQTETVDVLTTSERKPVTFAEIADMLNAAKSQDIRDAAADLIGEIADEGQRIELSKLYEALSAT